MSAAKDSMNSKPTTDLFTQISVAVLFLIVETTETMTVTWQFKTHLDGNTDKVGLQSQTLGISCV